MSNEGRFDSTWAKSISCLSLLGFSVAATIFADASKSPDGSYPYNTVMIPCLVEGCKLIVSALIIMCLKLMGKPLQISLSFRVLFLFAIPALCYFVSNNCMFYIIRELGPTTFQIMNNLKIVTTGILMRIIMGRKLSWLQWKALILLVVGSMVSQLGELEIQGDRSFFVGYTFVVISATASGAGGVIAEKLLKGKDDCIVESIHWQNLQLYTFGFIFGLLSTYWGDREVKVSGFLHGFNVSAYFTVISLTVCGLLVSFILKYIDNFAKCFVSAVSMLLVAVLHAALRQTSTPLQLILAIIIVAVAIEQYCLV